MSESNPVELYDPQTGQSWPAESATVGGIRVMVAAGTVYHVDPKGRLIYAGGVPTVYALRPTLPDGTRVPVGEITFSPELGGLFRWPAGGAEVWNSGWHRVCDPSATFPDERLASPEDIPDAMPVEDLPDRLRDAVVKLRAERDAERWARITTPKGRVVELWGYDGPRIAEPGPRWGRLDGRWQIELDRHGNVSASTSSPVCVAPNRCPIAPFVAERIDKFLDKHEPTACRVIQSGHYFYAIGKNGKRLDSDGTESPDARGYPFHTREAAEAALARAEAQPAFDFAVAAWPRCGTLIRSPDDDKEGWYSVAYLSKSGVGIIHGFDGDVAEGRHLQFSELLSEKWEISTDGGETWRLAELCRRAGEGEK